MGLGVEAVVSVVSSEEPPPAAPAEQGYFFVGGRYTQTKDDDALNRLAIYMPTGYTASLTAAPGSTIGSVTSVVQANAISADALVPLNGTIRVDAPSAHAGASDVACRQGAPALAVWVLVLQSPTGPLEVPVHVMAPTAASGVNVLSISG